MYQEIFKQGKIGNITLKNRLVMSPMGTSLAEMDGSPSEDMIAFYEARAIGGAALIIPEIARVNDLHGAGMMRQLSVSKDRHIEGLAKLAETVHKYGTKIFIQLHHPGRETVTALTGGPVDAHDARVQNATPLHGFETIQPSYQFIKALLNHEKGLHIDNDHFMIISPDEGSMNRAIYLANILGVDMGMYYKRLDYSKRINGRHPIAAYEFLGPNLKGKDMILIDDMISSGDTVLKISSLLKERGAGRIYICSTFGLFTNGLEKFDEAHKAGVFDKLLTTNLIYQSPELLAKDYYISCDMSKYIALIIDTLNHDQSVSYLLNPVDRINRCVSNYMAQYDEK